MCSYYYVSRSGYYAWVNRRSSIDKDTELIRLIEECHKKHKRRYGYRRVCIWLEREKGFKVNHKRVLRVMGKYGLLSVIRRRRLNKYKPNGDLIYANILDRDFHAERPNQKWVTDITYIITPGGTLYLSAIRDLYDQYIVAYKTSTRQDYDLVGRTIKAALAAECPSGTVILHSDQGGQYRSFDYRHDTKTNDITPSMSHPGTPGDNAMAENFFSIFKVESVYLEKPKNTTEADAMVTEFIDYYNFERHQETTGMTPYEKRRAWFEAQAR